MHLVLSFLSLLSTLSDYLSGIRLVNAIQFLSTWNCTSLLHSYSMQRCVQWVDPLIIKGKYVLLLNESEIFNENTVVGGRLTGLVVQEFHIRYSEDEITFHFHVPSGYEYFAFAEILYQNFKFGPFLESSLLTNHTLFTDRFDVAPFYPHDHTFTASVDNETKPFCQSIESSPLAGYWVLPTNALPAIGWLHDTQVDLCVKCITSTYKFHNCELKKEILAPITWCLIGDSQTRHLANAISRIYLNLPPEIPVFNHSDHRENFHRKIHYFKDTWGGVMDYGGNIDIEQFFTSISNSSACDIVTLNFGQWHLSHATHGQPLSVSKYEAAVRHYISVAVRMFGRDRLLWLTVHPCGEIISNGNFSIFGSGRLEFRSSHYLGLFAKASVHVAKSLRVAYFDIFSVANAIHDTSYDGCHYKGPLEGEVAWLVYHKALEVLGR